MTTHFHEWYKWIVLFNCRDIKFCDAAYDTDIVFDMDADIGIGLGGNPN
jgi:hypothetical protein